MAIPNLTNPKDEEDGGITINHISFNQDNSGFVCGTNHGFQICKVDPYSVFYRRELGGIRIVEILFLSNILVFVSDEQPTKVFFWDDSLSEIISEFSFHSEIRGIRLRRDRLYVILDKKLSVYDLLNYKFLQHFETSANPKGLCAVSQNTAGNIVLVSLGIKQGQVRIDQGDGKQINLIAAHDSAIACITLTHDGNLLATHSTKGTLVCIFRSHDGQLLRQVRRRNDVADICSLSLNADWLTILSHKGTLHLFKVTTVNDSHHDTSNSARILLKGIIPTSLVSAKSLAQFSLPKASRKIVALDNKKKTVVIVDMDGTFYRCSFDPLSGKNLSIEAEDFLFS